MSAIFKREFKSYFTSPLGYVYLAIFLFFEGYFFVNLFGYGSPNNEIIFPSLSIVVVLVTPVLTMRLLSEERRQKIDQALLTAPVSVTGISIFSCSSFRNNCYITFFTKLAYLLKRLAWRNACRRCTYCNWYVYFGAYRKPNYFLHFNPYYLPSFNGASFTRSTFRSSVGNRCSQQNGFR